MPSVFETVTSLLGQGGNMQQLSTLVGADVGQTAYLVGGAAPAVLGGVADKAAEPGGIDNVMRMLDGVDDSVVGDLGHFIQAGNPQTGVGILTAIFGHDPGGLVGALTSQTGADQQAVSRLLPMLAPIVMGVLKHRRLSDNLDGPALMSLLAREKSELDENSPFDFGWMSKTPVGASVGTGAVGSSALVADAVSTSSGDTSSVGASTVSASTSTVSAGASTVDAGAAPVSGAGKAAGLATATSVSAGKANAETGHGAVATATETRPVPGGDVGGAVAGSVGTASAAAETVNSASAGGTGGGGMKVLPWFMAGLATVLVLAWALSQCESSDADDAGAPGTTSEDSAEGNNSDSDGEPIDSAEGSEAATGATEIAGMQSDVDAALLAADLNGATAAVGGDGVVTLTGTADSEEAKASAAESIAGLEGVVSVNNQLVVTPSIDNSDQEATDEDEPATINEELSLEPITFEVISARITADGQAVLDKAADYLTANPDVNIEIAGHTDADGDQVANMALSQARAESVKAYLESKGVDGERMTARGYGSSQPVASNDTLDGKAQNRRIEFLIL